MEEDGIWLDGLLDADTAMIPKTDGDSLPLWQQPPCSLFIAYRLWAIVRLQHLQELFESWVPRSVSYVGFQCWVWAKLG